MRHCDILVCVLHGLFLAYRPPVTAAETVLLRIRVSQSCKLKLASSEESGQLELPRILAPSPSLSWCRSLAIIDLAGCQLSPPWPVFAFMPLWTLSIRYLTARVTYTRLSRARLTSYESPSGIKTIGVLSRCIETMFAPSMIPIHHADRFHHYTSTEAEVPDRMVVSEENICECGC